MSLPGNGIFAVQGEMSLLVTAMRRSTRWGSHSLANEEYDVLMKTFQDLKTILNQVDDLRLLDPATYLSPFLEVIRSKETTGPVTSLALSAIHKFLSYGLIDPTHPSVPATVEDIAEAVTHARFVGTDHSSDGVVLMKILQVLRTLMLSPEGALLTDESVCEIMLSCFRICFETRLTELLRRNAEQCLRDMTQLIFMRLPQFAPGEANSSNFSSIGLSLKKREKTAKKKSLSHAQSTNSLERKSPTAVSPTTHDDSETKPDHLLNRHSQDKNLLNESEITIEPVEVSSAKKHARHSSMDLASSTSLTQLLEKCVSSADDGAERTAEPAEPDGCVESHEQDKLLPESPTSELNESDPATAATVATDPANVATDPVTPATDEKLEEYVNHRGIRFTPQDEVVNLQPYGLVCVRELFRFLISLCNPLDPQNTSGMVHLGLTLVGTALEVSADLLEKYPSLMQLIKDPLCRNLLSLLNTERISIFALDLQISFLLFEALRFNLKFQMEAFFKKLIEIISADTTKAIYELKEIHYLALESLAQMFRIPGLCTELYLNYDCDVYCMNVFEELTKLLSKNVVSSTAYNVHSLSLEAIMTIIEAIELAAAQAKESKSEIDVAVMEGEKETQYGRSGHISLELGGMDDQSVSDHVTRDISDFVQNGRSRRHHTTSVPTDEELDKIAEMKKWVTMGTELFNQKPERAIEFLQEHGVLATPLDPRQVAAFLRENPDLDKKMIGEYICARSSRGDDTDGPSVLGAFADSFDYAGLRIEQALRLYLETFRLPGEAPLIFLVMERFATRWHTTNGSPFANTDAAFRLAYAVIMLNMDQHNHNAKKLNVPMTVTDFVRNLRGCNGNGDFDQKMLEEVFYSIKNEEMVMPAERVGPVRDAYLWRVLQRRGAGTGAGYRVPAPRPGLAARLLATAAPSAVTALSAAFERAPPPTDEQLASSADDSAGGSASVGGSAALSALGGLARCAALLARLPAAPGPRLSIDSLLLALAKASSLTQSHYSRIEIGVALGSSRKSCAAWRGACAMAARHADCVRDAWRHLLDAVRTLYVGELLPKCLVEVEDYLSPTGTVSLIRDYKAGSETGLLSSLYSYISLGESGARAPTPAERALIDIARDCVSQCGLPALLVTETKVYHEHSLQELVRAMIALGTPPDADSVTLNPQLEDITIFFLELLGQTLIQNRDRLSLVWEDAAPHYSRTLSWACGRTAGTRTRVLTALLRTSARLMRQEACAEPVLGLLRREVLGMRPAILRRHSTEIAGGLFELVKTSAQNVHSAAQWDCVLDLLCAAGAGVCPNTNNNNAASSRSEGSDSEGSGRPTSVSSESELSHSHGWIVVPPSGGAHVSGAARARCAEALALVVRDVAHVTPHNCRAAVRAVRALAAARARKRSRKSADGSRRSRSERRGRGDESSDDDDDDASDQDYLVSIQLLDLMHTLHSRIAQIYKWWHDEADQGQSEEDYDLWEIAWKPLLQGIAQYCTDKRKQVADSAIAYLQRALLVPGLGGLGGAGWLRVFARVLFPLLDKLAGHPRAARANTIMCKVFLQHLSALSSVPQFGAVWTRILDVQRRALTGGAGGVRGVDDAQAEAALESLKNMLLVLHSVRIFQTDEGYNELWYLTWDKINEFLPTLKLELFPEEKTEKTSPSTNMPSPVPANVPTLVPIPSNDLLSQTHSPNSQSQAPMSPVNLSQSPPVLANTPTLVAPTPISGMVPIRNPLYDQTGLTSSVLLQPLNEMISTPIGISIQSQMPILYARTEPQPILQPTAPPQTHPDPPQTHPDPPQTHPDTPQTHPDPPLDNNYKNITNIHHGELYDEYITNPYTEKKNLSEKEATLYDPEAPKLPAIDPESLVHLTVVDKQKSLSTNTTPMHTKNRTQFGSSDNIKQDSSIFNFTSYFGSNEVIPPGAEVFDSLVSGHEG